MRRGLIWLDLYRGHYYVSSNGNHRTVLLKHFGKEYGIRTVKARVTEYLDLENEGPECGSSKEAIRPDIE
jgi:hypothetical protein